MFKKLAAAVVVINEIEALLGVIESAFFHTRYERDTLEREQFFLHVSKREGEMMIYRRGGGAARSGLAQQFPVSTVFQRVEIGSNGYNSSNGIWLPSSVASLAF